MTTSTFFITGLTCDHCVNAIKEEVGEISGVSEVTADHTTGAVTVSGTDFTDEQVAAAVTEAGYTLK